jgi:tripartite-type tricarboxylate transporter receptor subunit TctC
MLNSSELNHAAAEEKMTRICGLIVGLWASLIAGSPAAQTTYPERPIRLVVGFPPGSQADTLARLVAQQLSEGLRNPIVVDNVTGAGGNVAADRVAKAAPDGYTLGLLGQPQLIISPILYKLAYEPMRDFAPVSQVAVSSSMLVVHNAVLAKSVQELVALAKAQPGALTFASGGGGSSPHVAAELFKSVAGLDIQHIPYKGVPLAIPDLLAGRVTMTFGPTLVVLPLVREGKLRALAVTSLRRLAAAPELPTIAESGYPGFEATSWNGLFAPARTPAMIVQRLNFETVNALALAQVRAKLADLGLEGSGNSPDEFAAVINSEIPKWASVIRESGMKPN